MSADKLYIVTRRDLALGCQAAQSCHALRQFTAEHPTIDSNWFKTSNYIVILAVQDEASLVELSNKARVSGLAVAEFTEPDINNELTAIAIEPCPESRRLCKNLKLAFNV